MLAKRLSNFLLQRKSLGNHHLGFLLFRESHTVITMLHQDILQAKQNKKISWESLWTSKRFMTVYIDGLIQKGGCLDISGPILR